MWKSRDKLVKEFENLRIVELENFGKLLCAMSFRACRESWVVFRNVDFVRITCHAEPA
jgi:hypothetical protein